jgi:hypothetical protein
MGFMTTWFLAASPMSLSLVNATYVFKHVKGLKRIRDQDGRKSSKKLKSQKLNCPIFDIGVPGFSEQIEFE